MTIEKLKKEDIPQLLDLYKELVEYDNTVKQAEKVYDKMLANDDYYLVVAKDNDKIVGTMLGVCCDDLAVMGRPFMVVESVIVSEKYRGQGIARKLSESLDDFAKEKKCSFSIIVSSGHRKTAHKFYESMGYTDSVRGFRKNYF